MNEYRLRVSIDRLRQEMDRLPEHDATTRRRLNALVDEIERMDHEADGVHEDRTLIMRLEDEIASLEVTHPSLTVALNDLLEVLTAAGI
jgi:uncharacterized protein YlxW (UPF0749 family)